MTILQISPDVSPDVLSVELASLAMSIHQIAGQMPVVAMGRNQHGILIEKGDVYEVMDESVVLNEIFRSQNFACVRAKRGRYVGMPIYASAIIGKTGKPLAAVGLIDTHGLLNMKSWMDVQSLLETHTLK